MTVPTPEQFLGTPSTEDDEDEAPPESAAAPREVVENDRIGPILLAPGAHKLRPTDEWTVDPGTMWQLPPTDIAGYVAQIAADVRRIAEATNVKITTDGQGTYYSESINVYGDADPAAVSAEMARLTQDRSQLHQNVSDQAEDQAPHTWAAKAAETGQLYQDALQQIADLEAQLQTLTELVEEIKGIVKPSKSQVSLEVKAAIERWANPQVDMAEGDQRLAEAQAAGEVTPTSSQGTEDAGTHTQTSYGEGGPDYCQECSAAIEQWVQWPCPAFVLLQEANPTPVEPVVSPAAVSEAPAGPVQPEPTDHVEAWRKYARAVRPEAKWEGMNRSQIRTALGIAQPVQDPA